MKEIQADQGAIGHLTMTKTGPWRILIVYGAGDDAQQNPIIPVLFDAMLVSMHGPRMMFVGFERQGDQSDLAPAVMQEWSVQVMAEQPPVPQPTHRVDGSNS